jgi:GDP-mannose 6-dehydrogenase
LFVKSFSKNRESRLEMQIAVLGLGYVGSVTATLLAERGNVVVGVDVNPTKIRLINSGTSPVIEPGLQERLAAAVSAGRLKAVADAKDAGAWEVAFVCVATPSGSGGQLDTSAMRIVLQQVGTEIRLKGGYRVIAIRSTTQSHILNEVVVPTLAEAAGSAPGERYGLVVTPEFLREGVAVGDFLEPPFTLIGQSDQRAGDVVAGLFSSLRAPVLRMSMGEAVMVKYASNAYHALKVAFANEIGLLCASEGLDGGKVMQAFCLDTKLNVSSSYLIPGFAFGGSCLPKDLRALNYRARQLGLETPLLASVLPSNRSYLEHCIESVLTTDRRRIGIFGMSFKAGTDDLRESPMITLVETLIGKGKEVAIFDSQVRLAHLTGTNRQYIDSRIPHIASLMYPTIDEVLARSDLLVIGNRDAEFAALATCKRSDQTLIDFTRAPEIHSATAQPHRT